MDIIEMARELGKQIQQDDRYIALRLATQSNSIRKFRKPTKTRKK